MSCDGRAHAKPGIAVDIIRTDKTLYQFVDDIIFLGQALAGNIETDTIRAIPLDEAAKYGGRAVQSRIPGHALQRHAAILPHLGMEQPVAPVIDRIMQVEPLAA